MMDFFFLETLEITINIKKELHNANQKYTTKTW